MRTLTKLLDAELAYDAVTAQGFSDHLPMALVALHGLGADDARLAAFSDRYARNLVAARPEVVAARARYTAELDALGVDATLHEHLPRFVPGLGTAAFHCVIRLAYAVETGHSAQVAAALAYFDEFDEPLTTSPPPETGDDPLALLAALRTHPGLAGRHFGTGSISGQMAKVAATPEFAATAGLAVDDDTRALAVRFRFQAIAAAYLTIATPEIVSVHTADAPSWDEIVAAALVSDDEHVVKLAYSAHAEAVVWGDDATYRWCVALEAGLR